MQILNYKNEDLGITSQDVQAWIQKHTRHPVIDWILRRNIFSETICKHPLFKYVLYMELLCSKQTVIHDKWMEMYNTYFEPGDQVYFSNFYIHLQYELIKKGFVLDVHTATLYKPDKIWTFCTDGEFSKRENYFFTKNDALYNLNFYKLLQLGNKLEDTQNKPYRYLISKHWSASSGVSDALCRIIHHIVDKSLITNDTYVKLLYFINDFVNDEQLKQFLTSPFANRDLESAQYTNFKTDVLLNRYQGHPHILLLLNMLIKIDVPIEQLLETAKTKDFKIEPEELPVITF